MRILFVANGNFKHKGERSHLFDNRIRNGFIRNGHHLYFMSDRDVAREGGIIGKMLAKKRVSKTFLDIVKNFQPDLIFLGQADWIDVNDLLEAKEIIPTVKIAAYCIDIVFSKHIEQTILSKIDALDAIFCTTAGEAIRKRFKRNHNKVAYIPNPCDESIDYLKCEQNSSQEYDVFWAMRGMRFSYDDDPRFAIPRALSKDKEIKIDYYGFDDKPILLGREYYHAMSNCKGGLNISVSRLNETANIPSEDLYLYSSDRIGHYFGCGLLVYIPRGFGLEELLLEDKYALYFDGLEDLSNKIKFYSKNDDKRIEIATAGANFYRTHLNEKTVTQYMLDIVFDNRTKNKFIWNTNIY